MELRRRTGEGDQERAGWLVGLNLAPAENLFDAESQTARVRRVAALWPAAFYSILIAMALIFAPLVALGDLDMLALASIPAGAILIIGVSLWAGFKAKGFWRLRPDIQTKIGLPVAVGLGVSMAALGLIVSGSNNAEYVMMSLVALAAAGVVILASLLSMHVVALTFVGSLVTVGSLFSGDGVFAVLGVSMFACLWIVSLAQARFDNLLSDRRAQEDSQSRRASRLIAEFEANGAGWFWETDRGGNLVYISEKLANVLGKRGSELIGKPFTQLIAGEGGSDDGERTLGFHLSTRNAFSDISVKAAFGEEERWWSISGRPIIDDIGQFRGFTGSGTDLTEKRRSQDEVNRLARYDELTGLFNRQQMRVTLDEALRDNKGGSTMPVALFLLDLDRFKSVNDTMGHPVGDELLKQVAQRLFRTVGDKGRVGRMGGDEFQVILPNIDKPDDLTHLAKVIISTLSQPYMIDGVTLNIGCSIGIAISPDHGKTASELTRNADLALYAAKGDGRGVHRFYQRDMHSGAKNRKRLEEDLRTALANDELHLVYQPQVSTADERIVGYEALIRWNHPSRGAISPADFIPVAEDIRLIEQMGEWIIRQACHDCKQWPADVRVAVNVSPIQFANPELAKIVTSALANSDLPSRRLELEITESIFLDEDADTDAMFKRIKALGVRLALDDFGTGYSALGYLKTAPFDKIKIDQSFIRGAAVAGNRNAAIIKAIVSLAKTLYMETTAEGVEHEDEITLIRELGCSHIQGYIYGKPMAHDEVIRQLSVGQGKATANGHRASRGPRTQVLRSSNVEYAGETKRVVIKNISAGGAMIEGLKDAEVDTDIMIEILEDQMFRAKVRWSNAERTGIEFARAFDMERLNRGSQSERPRKAASG